MRLIFLNKKIMPYLYTSILATSLLGSLFSNALIGLSMGLILLASALSFSKYNLILEPFFPDIRQELWAMLPLFIGTLFGILISEDLKEGWKQGRSSLQFCFIPLFCVCVKYIDLRKILYLLLLALSVEFGIGLFHAWEHGGFDFRFYGFRPFGTDAQFCLLTLIFCIFLLKIKQFKSWAVYGVLLSSVFMMLTQTRQTFICFVILLPFLLYKKKYRKQKYFGIVLATGVALISLFAFVADKRLTPSHIIQKITDEASKDNASSSMGTRYELWRASFVSLSETNGLGTGYGDFKKDLFLYMEEGKIAKDINTTLHLHSIYLHPLMCGGILGLLGITISLIWLIVVLVKRIFNSDNPSYQFKLYLILTLVLTGIVDAHLEDSAKIFSYAFFWGIAPLLDSAPLKELNPGN